MIGPISDRGPDPAHRRISRKRLYIGCGSITRASPRVVDPGAGRRWRGDRLRSSGGRSRTRTDRACLVRAAPATCYAHTALDQARPASAGAGFSESRPDHNKIIMIAESRLALPAIHFLL